MNEYIPMILFLVTSALWYIAGHPRIEKWPTWCAPALWVAGTVSMCAAALLMILDAQ